MRLRHRLLALALAAVCLLTAAWLAAHARDEARVRDANALGIAHRYADAIAEARPVTRTPTSGRAALVQGHAHAALGQWLLAAQAYHQAARRDPDNWEIRRSWAYALLRSGDLRAARRQYARARELNPKLAPLPQAR